MSLTPSEVGVETLLERDRFALRRDGRSHCYEPSARETLDDRTGGRGAFGNRDGYKVTQTDLHRVPLRSKRPVLAVIR
jgi:hypothetical protein